MALATACNGFLRMTDDFVPADPSSIHTYIQTDPQYYTTRYSPIPMQCRVKQSFKIHFEYSECIEYSAVQIFLDRYHSHSRRNGA